MMTSMIKEGAVVFGEAAIGIIGFFVLIWMLTLPLQMYHTPIESGEYTGQTIDYTHQRGLIFKTNDLTTKTNDRSSSREHWCVNDQRPELVEKVRSIDEGDKVRIEYSMPLFVWIDHCSSGHTKQIDSIEVVDSAGDDTER